MPTPPDVTQVQSYLGDAGSWSIGQIQSALDAETAAQAAVCKLPVDPAPPAEPLPYPDDLAEALKRRVHRNLSMKALPLGLQTAMSEAAVATIRVGSDPEVRRLEAPYRKRVVG